MIISRSRFRQELSPKEKCSQYLKGHHERSREKDLEIKFINNYKGSGVFAKMDITQGEFLTVYHGELIDKKTGECRLREKGGGYLFFVGNHCIDASNYEHIGRYINDSVTEKHANVRLKNENQQNSPNICFFAKRNIAKGEELTYYYGQTDSHMFWRLDKPTFSKKTSTDTQVCCSNPLNTGENVSSEGESFAEAKIVSSNGSSSFMATINDTKITRLSLVPSNALCCSSPFSTREVLSSEKTDLSESNTVVSNVIASSTINDVAITHFAVSNDVYCFSSPVNKEEILCSGTECFSEARTDVSSEVASIVVPRNDVEGASSSVASTNAESCSFPDNKRVLFGSDGGDFIEASPVGSKDVASVVASVLTQIKDIEITHLSAVSSNWDCFNSPVNKEEILCSGTECFSEARTDVSSEVASIVVPSNDVEGASSSVASTNAESCSFPANKRVLFGSDGGDFIEASPVGSKDVASVVASVLTQIKDIEITHLSAVSSNWDCFNSPVNKEEILCSGTECFSEARTDVSSEVASIVVPSNDVEGASSSVASTNAESCSFPANKQVLFGSDGGDFIEASPVGSKDVASVLTQIKDIEITHLSGVSSNWDCFSSPINKEDILCSGTECVSEAASIVVPSNDLEGARSSVASTNAESCSFPANKRVLFGSDGGDFIEASPVGSKDVASVVASVLTQIKDIEITHLSAVSSNWDCFNSPVNKEEILCSGTECFSEARTDVSSEVASIVVPSNDVEGASSSVASTNAESCSFPANKQVLFGSDGGDFIEASPVGSKDVASVLTQIKDIEITHLSGVSSNWDCFSSPINKEDILCSGTECVSEAASIVVPSNDLEGARSSFVSNAVSCTSTVNKRKVEHFGQAKTSVKQDVVIDMASTICDEFSSSSTVSDKRTIYSTSSIRSEEEKCGRVCTTAVSSVDTSGSSLIIEVDINTFDDEDKIVEVNDASNNFVGDIASVNEERGLSLQEAVELARSISRQPLNEYSGCSDDSEIDPDFDVMLEDQSESESDESLNGKQIKRGVLKKKSFQATNVQVDDLLQKLNNEVFANEEEHHTSVTLSVGLPVSDPSTYHVTSSLKMHSGKNKSYKTNVCTFCQKIIKSKLCRHFMSVHKAEERVAEFMVLPKRSAERKKLIQLLANEGNFKHNASVLKSSSGQVVVGRRSVEHAAREYLPCEFCKKFLVKKSLWRHFKSCIVRKEYYAKYKHDEIENCSENVHITKTKENAVRGGRQLLNSAILEENEDHLEYLFQRMRDDELKDMLISDKLIRRYASLKMESLGKPEDQKLSDVHRVSQGVRTLAKVLIEARKTDPLMTLSKLITPANFVMVVNIAKRMSTERKTPVLNVGRTIGHLLGHVVRIKCGVALRENDDNALQEASNFEKLHKEEWNFRVNSAAVKMMAKVKRSKISSIPVTEDLQLLRKHILQKMKEISKSLRLSPNPQDWTLLAKFCMARLIIFNKRRRAEVKDLQVEQYLNRPKWNDDSTGEMKLALSPVDLLCAKRMDMVISAGKSRKNVDAFVILPPDARQALDILIEYRAAVGVPPSNRYIFARMSADTPLSGNTDLQEVVQTCAGLQFPERITSTNLRKYIGTVSQIMDMNDQEIEVLARHLGHDSKTHKEYYRLTHSTVQLSKVSQMLMAVDNGMLHEFKGKGISEINIEDLPSIESDVEDCEESEPRICSYKRNRFVTAKSGHCQVASEDVIPDSDNESDNRATCSSKRLRVVASETRSHHELLDIVSEDIIPDSNGKSEKLATCQSKCGTIATPGPLSHEVASKDVIPDSINGESDKPVTCSSKRSRVVTSGTKRRELQVISNDVTPDSDGESDEFPVASDDVSLCKHAKRRWSSKEFDILFREFGSEITNKKIPSGKRIADLLVKLPKMRTVAQIRSQIHNIISGKVQIGNNK